MEPESCVTGQGTTEVDAFPRIDFRSLAEFPSAEERTCWPSMAVIIDDVAFEAIRQAGKLEGLSSDTVAKYSAPRATISAWEELGQNIGATDVVVSVGGGTCVDAAKWIAAKRRVPLVCIPSALTVDAFFTGWSGFREAGCVQYTRTTPPALIVCDLAVLAAAPQRIRAAGICDVLSIATGLNDWRYAVEHGKCSDENRYDPMAAKMAEAILEATYGCAGSAGRGEEKGIRRLLDVLSLEVTMCNQIGHSRPEEGSEHFLCYCIENLDDSGKRYTHAELVGPSQLVISTLQGDAENTAKTRQAYKDAGLSLTEVSML